MRYVKRKAARDVDKALIRTLSVLVQTLSEELDRWRNWSRRVEKQNGKELEDKEVAEQMEDNGL